ncbi:MAG: hypothetical protein V1495_07255 [Pseudomonadota bacterium]
MRRRFPPPALLVLIGFLVGACGGTSVRTGTTAEIFTSDGQGIAITFPHPSGFAAMAAHGPLALGTDGKLAVERCNGCHDIDGRRTDGPPGCRSCHAGYPHRDQWVAAYRHGTEAKETANSGYSGCTSCHATGGTSPGKSPACSTCHTTLP